MPQAPAFIAIPKHRPQTCPWDIDTDITSHDQFWTPHKVRRYNRNFAAWAKDQKTAPTNDMLWHVHLIGDSALSEQITSFQPDGPASIKKVPGCDNCRDLGLESKCRYYKGNVFNMTGGNVGTRCNCCRLFGLPCKITSNPTVTGIVSKKLPNPRRTYTTREIAIKQAETIRSAMHRQLAVPIARLRQDMTGVVNADQAINRLQVAIDALVNGW